MGIWKSSGFGHTPRKLKTMYTLQITDFIEPSTILQLESIAIYIICFKKYYT